MAAGPPVCHVHGRLRNHLNEIRLQSWRYSRRASQRGRCSFLVLSEYEKEDIILFSLLFVDH